MLSSKICPVVLCLRKGTEITEKSGGRFSLRRGSVCRLEAFKGISACKFVNEGCRILNYGGPYLKSFNLGCVKIRKVFLCN